MAGNEDDTEEEEEEGEEAETDYRASMRHSFPEDPDGCRMDRSDSNTSRYLAARDTGDESANNSDNNSSTMDDDSNDHHEKDNNKGGGGGGGGGGHVSSHSPHDPPSPLKMPSIPVRIKRISHDLQARREENGGEERGSVALSSRYMRSGGGDGASANRVMKTDAKGGEERDDVGSTGAGFMTAEEEEEEDDHCGRYTREGKEEGYKTAVGSEDTTHESEEREGSEEEEDDDDDGDSEGEEDDILANVEIGHPQNVRHEAHIEFDARLSRFTLHPATAPEAWAPPTLLKGTGIYPLPTNT